MNVLITGAAGFLGSNIVKVLLENRKHNIKCLVRQKAGTDKLLSIIKYDKGNKIEILEGNLVNPIDARLAVKDVDIIYHCAAMMKGSTADMFYNTVIGSRNLLEALLQENVRRVVLVSSFSVYGVAGLPRMGMVNELTPFEKYPTKRDAYSYTKCKQETLFWEYVDKYKMPLVIVRPGVIYGEGASPFSTRIGLKLFGCFFHLGNSNLIPLTHVRNCAEAIVLAGEVPDIEGQIFNIHDDDLITSKEYLKLYKNQVEKIRSINIPFKILLWLSRLNERYFVYSKGQLPDIFTNYKTLSNWKGQRFDNTKAKFFLNWAPSITIEAGINRFFEYLKNNKV
jgi:2-alkyl-3-oxoalkanoate reductase